MDIIQGLWIGNRLSTMERLSIASFLHHGHPYHLYLYDDVEGVPEGTVVKDAAEILPQSAVFTYTAHKTYAAFSNFFRYKLLLERGGWWADTDMVCLQPLHFTDAHVFATETFKGETITSGLIKAPQGSEAMAYAWSVCQSKDPTALTWGEVGPRLVGETVKRLGLDAHVRPPQYFCPYGYREWRRALDPKEAVPHQEENHTLHLWHEMWRRSETDKDAAYAPTCPYEQLKAAYLQQPAWADD